MSDIQFNFFEHLEKNNIFEQDIIEFEKKYNCNFPEDYKSFLIKYNGGYLSSTIQLYKKDYDIYNMYSPKTSISRLYALKQIIDILKNDSFYIEDELQIVKTIPKTLFPIATDGIGIFTIFIGAGHDNKGKIYSYDHQGEYCELGDELKYLCETFTDFISGFKITEDNLSK